ncbi:hypothetical protein MAR_032334, partial [Mya arenaria]
YSTPTYGGWYVYSSGAVAAFMFVAVVPRLRKSLQPSENWGPNDVKEREMYHKANTPTSSLRSAIWLNITGNR